MERLQKQNGNLWIICHFVLSLKVKVKDSMMTIVNIVLNAGSLQVLSSHIQMVQEW